MNKLEYRIENDSLIIDNYFNNLKIGSVNYGKVESILGKCKLFDEEYETLLKENEYMKHIVKDFEQLPQDNEKLKERIEYLERSNNRREDTILEQKQKISDLEDKVDKAIKYIEKFIPIDEDTILMKERQRDYLLDILKGVIDE